MHANGGTPALSRDQAIRAAYAADASGVVMLPDAVARPTTGADVAELLRWASADRVPVTTAGGQTSTTAASIASHGILLSTRSMDRVLELDVERGFVRVEAGAMLGDVKRLAADRGLLLAPDPTSEEECTVGGAVACNASGARTLAYGPTRNHVRALRVALANGEVVDIRRATLEKNTAGYAFAAEPVDWFVGSEGTLGVVLEAELALLPRPAHVTGLLLQFPSEQHALGFVVDARRSAAVRPRCLEYLDPLAGDIFFAGEGGARAEARRALVYVEEAAPSSELVALDEWLALAERHDALVDDTLVYDDEPALREARRRRHAVPATMNERGVACRSAGGRKVSTDWAVPLEHLAAALAHARAIAAAARIAQPVIYGHAGNGHPHQNFIASDGEELRRVEQVVEETLRHIIRLGGTVSAEHGIGKLKRRWLPLQMSPRQIAVMRAVKRELDPDGILAPENVL